MHQYKGATQQSKWSLTKLTTQYINRSWPRINISWPVITFDHHIYKHTACYFLSSIKENLRKLTNLSMFIMICMDGQTLDKWNAIYIFFNIYRR